VTVMALTCTYRVTPLAKRPHCLAGIPSSSQKALPEADRRHLATSNLLGTGSKVCLSACSAGGTFCGLLSAASVGGERV
jgi:hypothetical protein